MAGERARFRCIEHTADVGVEVRAPSLSSLFGGAGRALSALLFKGKIHSRPFCGVKIDAPDPETLLVDWLNELLYLHTVGGWLVARFQVKVSGLESLRAVVSGERLDPLRHVVLREVKAATFHNLRLRRQGGIWSARIIFDI